MTTRHEEAARELNQTYCIASGQSDAEYDRPVKNAEIAAILQKHYRELEDAAVAARDVLSTKECTCGDLLSTSTGPCGRCAALDALNKALGVKE